jgi:hypothetical protein
MLMGTRDKLCGGNPQAAKMVPQQLGRNRLADIVAPAASLISPEAAPNA